MNKAFRTLLGALSLAAALVVAVPASAGASGSAPSASTTTAYSVNATYATLEGTITPNGAAVSAASFCYGTSSTLAGCTSANLPSADLTNLTAVSSNDPVGLLVSGLAPGTTYFYSLSATTTNGTATSTAPYGTFTTPAAGPFSCAPALYQVSGTGNGQLYQLNIAANNFFTIGTSAGVGVNALGYNTVDNYMYAIYQTSLYRVDNSGTWTNLGSVAGLTSGPIAGDFYQGQLLVSGGNSNAWQRVNVSTLSASNLTMTSGTVGSITTGATWGAADMTVQGNYAYGLKNTTLYVADLATDTIASTTVAGLPSTGSYGAAYSDANGNAYFYNNGTFSVYEIPSAQLTAALAGTTPTANAVGSGPSTPNLATPNDGADCPNAPSLYSPAVNPPTTGTVTSTSAVVNGVVSPDDETLTAVDFCYSTSSTTSTAGALSASPTCVAVDPTTYPFGTWTGTQLNNVASTLTGLQACTQYFYQATATNASGTNYSTVENFTTSGCLSVQTIAVTLTPPGPLTISQTSTASASGTSGTGAISYAIDTGTNGHPSAAGCAVNALTGVVSATGIGTCYVDATIAADATYAAATSTDAALVFTPNTQTITYTSSDYSASPGTTYTPAATGGASGNPVTFSINPSSSSVCSLLAGVVTFLSAGICTINADQAGNVDYLAAATTPQIIAVAKANTTTIIVSSAPTPALSGVPEDFSVTVAPVAPATNIPTGAATVDDGHGGFCTATLDSSGNGHCQITESTAGPYSVTASYNGDSNFNTSFSAPLAITFATSVTLSFSPGTGTGSVTPVTVNQGSSVTLPGSTGLTAPSGESFAGWSDGTTTYQPGASYPVNASTTLTAVWKFKALVVTFVFGRSHPSRSIRGLHPGQVITLLSASIVSHDPGCTLAGWSGQPGATAVAYGPGTHFKVTGSSDLYAVWHCEKVVPLTVRQVGNGAVKITGGTPVAPASNLYAKNATEVIRATPHGKNRVVWGGSCASARGNICVVVMNDARTAVVHFVPDVQLPVFFFNTDQWNITISARQSAVVARDLRLLVKSGLTSLTINGYADVRGSSAHNLFLGSQRAAAAARYIHRLLVEMHLKIVRIKLVDHGATTKFGTPYQLDRRAQAEVTFTF